MTDNSLYQYKVCGLDNVWIAGVEPITDDAGEIVYSIDNYSGLHQAIARAIVWNRAGMSGKELRFLRTELRMTQDELAQLLHKEALSVSRWERGECPIDPNAETVIRMYAIEKLKLGKIKDIAELSKLSISGTQSAAIMIDGKDPSKYKPAKRKAA